MPEACRLCSSGTDHEFTLKVLGKYDVAYLRCRDCGSLQTEIPHWLAEAYGANNLGPSDAGAVVRCIHNQAAVYTICRFLRHSPRPSVLDFAGGNGLLCRLLRDVGLDARTSDPYAVNNFAQGFNDQGGDVDVVCAFEAAEHFSDPLSELARIFPRARSTVIMSTELYTGQGKDWWYLVPSDGQHVFFYSCDAMQKIAQRFEFHYRNHDSLHLFTRLPIAQMKWRALSKMLNDGSQKLVRAFLGYRLSFDQAGADSGLFPA